MKKGVLWRREAEVVERVRGCCADGMVGEF